WSDEVVAVAAGKDHADHPADVRILVREVPGEALVVQVGGEIDLSTASMLHEQLVSACARADGQRLRVDLGDVEFLGSAGLQVLLGVHSLCCRRGVKFEVVNPPRAALRAIQISGLDQALSVRMPDDDPDVNAERDGG
ncbi:MAG: STAS domain-containing protein, partial [Pseudonocardia sp.]|nr:STAS domain-containing protein [Pseudonocardia sp.]